MKMTLLAVGKTERGFVSEGMTTYLKRITRFFSCEFVDLKAGRSRGAASPEDAREAESEVILKAVRGRDILVLLDENGREFTSVQFASWLEAMLGESRDRVVFLIGGAHGVSDAVKARADHTIALSQMTFSHQLARLVFAEQLYRACTIMKGMPYHHE